MWRGIIFSALMTVSCAAHPQGTDNKPDAVAQLAATEASMASLNGGPVGLRADSDTDALHYDLHIDIDPDNELLDGFNTMTIMSRVNGLSVFNFRLDDVFTITAVEMNGQPVTWNRISSDTVEVTLDHVYNDGETFELYVAYNGHPNGGGFGSIIFTSHDGNPLVFTLSEPWYSYTWWPAKDDNTDKATGDMYFTVPDYMSVPSNGLLLEVNDLGNGRKEYHWQTQYQTATYLFSFSATVYNEFSDTWNYNDISMPLDFFIYPDEDSTGNRNAWLKTKNILTVFSDTYGVYPFADEKYGIYSFGFGGGMEHQTMTGQGTFSEWVTAHEAGHQWWGDMITCATWHDIWLNEGFATYSEAIYSERKNGTVDTQALIDYMAGRRPGSVNGSVYVYDISNVGRIFSGDFSYRKGAWVLHQLRHIVGDSTFFNILAQYRAAYEYSSATTEDFKNIGESVFGHDLDWFFDEWVYQVGAPTYEYAWQNITVGQRNFVEMLIKQVQDSSYPTFAMPIDLVTTDSVGEQTHVVWNDADGEHLLFEVDEPITGLQFDPQQWILWEGASQVSFTPGPAKIINIDPAPGTVAAPGDAETITVTFHKDVAAGAGNFSLVDENSVPVSFTFNYDQATQTATLTPDSALAAGSYTLTVADSVTDVETGLALDGELTHVYWDAAVLPSGDGMPGGDAVMNFTVLLAGDLDGDGDVDQADLGLLLSCYLLNDCGDLDGDGDTDQADLGILLANYGFGT